MATQDNEGHGRTEPTPNCESADSENSNNLAKILLEMKKTRKLLIDIKDSAQNNFDELTYYKERKGCVDVSIRTSFVCVGNIDTINQEFQCEFYLDVRWKEPALKEPALKGKKADDIEWEQYFDPKIYIIDAVRYDIYEKNQRVCYAEPGGEDPYVIQNFHIKGTFKEILEVDDFPFDYQDLTLVLTSCWTTNKVYLHKNPTLDDNIRIWNFTGKQEWDLQQHVLVESTQNTREEGSSPNIFPLYNVKLHVRRQCGFYIYNIALLMCLITALTFSTFAVSIDSTGDRIQITLTLLLTSVAFKYYVQQFVPTVSYLTFLGKYVLSCLIFQFGMAAIHNSVAGLISNKKSRDLFEWVCLYGGLSVFFAINIGFGISALVKVRRIKKKMGRNTTEYKIMNQGASTYNPPIIKEKRDLQVHYHCPSCPIAIEGDSV